MRGSILLFILISLTFLGCKRDATKEDNKRLKEYAELPKTKLDAVQLNNQVSSIQKGALSLIDSVFNADGALVSKKLDDAIFDLEVSISRLKSLADEHEMVAYFSESVRKLLEFYKTELELNFKALLPILKKTSLNVEEKNRLSSYDQEFVMQEAVLFEEIVIRQDSFAAFFGIKLVNQL